MTESFPAGARAADNGPRTLLRAIIDSLADGIVIVDQSGVIRFANPAAGRLFTRTPEALVGTPLGTPVMAGETTEMEIVRRGGGEVVYAELRVVETDWEGESAKLVSLRDITDRKYAEERASQLSHEREARLEAEAASRAKSDFLAIMSHELRTPLNAILGYSELIELGISGDVPPKMRDQLVRIRRAAKHLLGLVNDILDLAKVEAGRLSVDNAPASPFEAVTTALALIQPQADIRSLEVSMDERIRRLPQYIGDEERVRQILINLLSNAVKCTEPGGRIIIDGDVTNSPDPRARLQPRGTHIRITVSDTGSGIAADKLESIFEPFVQADNGHARTREGSGLGLTIGQRLARAMGGDLTVESTEGRGSEFTLWLPANQGGRALEPVAAAETKATTHDITRHVSRPSTGGNLKGLCEVAAGLLEQVKPILAIIVGRIRSDPALSMAKGLRTSQVSDHLGTLIIDIAASLLVVEDAAGEPTALLADSLEIQRLLAERHGMQRAKLGWTETSLRREFMIIREEIERAVRRSIPKHGTLQPADALAAVNRFVDQAEYLSVRARDQVKV
ncbi:MAG TPA: ATP-binding protein [Gemmatimonadaceae bacterium]|nr:ATP-binding protein [Gemmatimonadaceae bacterium]